MMFMKVTRPQRKEGREEEEFRIVLIGGWHSTNWHLQYFKKCDKIAAGTRHPTYATFQFHKKMFLSHTYVSGEGCLLLFEKCVRWQVAKEENKSSIWCLLSAICSSFPECQTGTSTHRTVLKQHLDMRSSISLRCHIPDWILKKEHGHVQKNLCYYCC